MSKKNYEFQLLKKILVGTLIFICFAIFFKFGIREYLIDYVRIDSTKHQPELINNEIYFMCKFCKPDINDYVVYKTPEKDLLGKVEKITDEKIFFSNPEGKNINKELIIGKILK